MTAETIEELGCQLSAALKPSLPNLAPELELEFSFQRKDQQRKTKRSAPVEKYFHPAPGDELVFRVVERPAAAGPVIRSPSPATAAPPTPTGIMRRLILALRELEGMNFVALKKFRDDFLPQRGFSLEEARGTLDEAIRREYVRVGKLANPKSPFPTSTVVLNHDHPEVREALASAPPAPRRGFSPMDLGGVKLSDAVLAGRR
ncbi:MAG: hypothetical protein ACRD04_09535 [Terriglobales bacterium]